jgi:hypothetical protein
MAPAAVLSLRRPGRVHEFGERDVECGCDALEPRQAGVRMASLDALDGAAVYADP